MLTKNLIKNVGLKGFIKDTMSGVLRESDETSTDYQFSDDGGGTWETYSSMDELIVSFILRHLEDVLRTDIYRKYADELDNIDIEKTYQGSKGCKEVFNSLPDEIKKLVRSEANYLRNEYIPVSPKAIYKFHRNEMKYTLSPEDIKVHKDGKSFSVRYTD